jgi:AcrR family transcriptional regulator
MNPFNPISENEAIRRRILDAAEARFRVYGCRKTTMAEIAEDADMSAANLYRYFEDKQDIAAACAQRYTSQRLELLREVVRKPGLSASEQLESFVLTMLRYTHEQTHQQKRINELVEIVTSERPGFVHEKNKAEQALIAEILAQGNTSSEFDVQDVIGSARIVHAALMLFEVPIFMPLYSLDELEKAAKDVVRLILRGLGRR